MTKKIKPKKLINLKVSDSEKKSIKAKADKFANGNISEWIRLSALNFSPKK